MWRGFTYRDSAVEAYGARWPGLTLAEAAERVKQLVETYMRKRKVVGVSVMASAQSDGAASLINEARWKRT